MNEHVWIGVNDIDEEGTFVSTDGRFITYTNWQSGQPNNNGINEDAGLIRTNGFWADDELTAHFKFICIYNIGEFLGYEYNLY